MKAISRRWVRANCLRTSDSERLRFCSVVWALKASIPPYVTEYRGGFPPFRISGRCFSASSSHVVTCARMSRTDQAPVTPGSISSESDKPAYDSLNATHALSSRFRSCGVSTLHPPRAESGRLPERQVDAVATHHGVTSLLEWHDAVIAKSGGSSPDEHVAVSRRYGTRRIGPARPPEEKD